MSMLYLRHFYTTLVEHYLQSVVHNSVNAIPKDKIEFTTKWIEKLSDKDRKFIQFVFNEEYECSFIGVGCYQNDNFLLNYRRLYELEKQFAVDIGLIAVSSEHEEV